MTDNFGGEPPVGLPEGPKPKSAVATFLSSSTGRLVVGGVLLFILLVVVGTLAFFFLINAGNQVAPPPPSPGASTPATSAAAPTDPPEQPLDDTFTFRNIFVPTVIPPVQKTVSTSTDSSSTSSTASTAQDTLILKSISVEDGVRVAVFEWNGQDYSCKEGDVVDDSPWKVLEIYSDSVLMLYGDSRITLTVGQGFTSDGASNTK
jgi:hypothetical protein